MSQYAVMGGDQDAIYKLAYDYDSDFVQSLEVGVPASYTVDLNSRTVTVSILMLAEPPDEPPPPPADNRRLQTLKEVTPETAPPNVETFFTYTIRVENRNDENEALNQIHDLLSFGFSYVENSTSGVTTNNPSIDGQQLTWGVSTTLDPGEWVELTFQAKATLAEGNYCNEAWVQPGDELTNSGKTAMVKVGSPGHDLCAGDAARVIKAVDPAVIPAEEQSTVTYTVTIENYGTNDLDITRIRDLLPKGFQYQPDSTTGDITSANPSINNNFNNTGRDRLQWNVSFTIYSGTTRTLEFKATAEPDAGEYWNEVWVRIDEYDGFNDYSLYTWPTGMVDVWGVFKTEASDGQTKSSSEIWIGLQQFQVQTWGIE